MRVEALIQTFNNTAGLNALLWSLWSQTWKPDRITIVNMGRSLALDPQLAHTIAHVSRQIPVQLCVGENTPGHYGRNKAEAIAHATCQATWLLEDDLWFAPDALEAQLGVELPNVPLFDYVDCDVSKDSEPELAKHRHGSSERTTRANVNLGLLALTSELHALIPELRDWAVGDDELIAERLRPWVCCTTTCIHTRAASWHPGTYALLERLKLRSTDA